MDMIAAKTAHYQGTGRDLTSTHFKALRFTNDESTSSIALPSPQPQKRFVLQEVDQLEVLNLTGDGPDVITSIQCRAANGA